MPKEERNRKMKHNYLPALFVIGILVLATIACNGNGSGNYTGAGQPREVRWAMIDGELTSHALDRWTDAFPTCRIVKHAAAVSGTKTTEYLAIWYTCTVDQ